MPTAPLKAYSARPRSYNAPARVHAKSHNLEEMKENMGRPCIASGGDRGTGVILGHGLMAETDWPMVLVQGIA